MALLEHIRVDEGIKRGTRIKLKKDRSPKGQWITAYTPEARKAAVEDALEALQRGETTDQIANRHGMPGVTLRTWLIADPRTDPARAVMVAAELSRTLQDMQNAQEPLALARAREEFRGWSWIAERRVPALYQAKHELTVNTVPVFNVMLATQHPQISAEQHTEIDVTPTQVTDK